MFTAALFALPTSAAFSQVDVEIGSGGVRVGPGYHRHLTIDPMKGGHFLFGVPVQDHHTQGVCCGLALSQKETPGSLRVPRVRGSLFSARLDRGSRGASGETGCCPVGQYV